MTVTSTQLQYVLLRSEDMATTKEEAQATELDAKSYRSHRRKDEPIFRNFNSNGRQRRRATGDGGDTAPPLQWKFAQECRRDARESACSDTMKEFRESIFDSLSNFQIHLKYMMKGIRRSSGASLYLSILLTLSHIRPSNTTKLQHTPTQTNILVHFQITFLGPRLPGTDKQ
jgi:hypothetical protein